MTREELINLRKDFLYHNSKKLKDIYLTHREECINLLCAKMKISNEQAGDIFVDALMVFRQNIVSEKIQNLSTVKAYLNSTCINMVREGWNYERRRRKKEEEIRLLFYEYSHTSMEERISKEEMLRISNEAFGKLSEKCQDILIAFYVYKIPMKEIAEEFGFATGDVAKMTKSRCFKAWRKEVNLLMS